MDSGAGRRAGAPLALSFVFFTGICATAEGAGAPAGGATLSRAERAELAQKVKGIFESKCAKCHTPDGSERKKYEDEADIDFILDLKKLASDSDIIERGDPAGSGLFLQVVDGSMPYSETDEIHLPKEEKRAIERWIEAGAPDEKGTVGTEVR
ncbi:MAG: hypothetical protein V3V56_00480 [bacterium]